MRSLEVVFGSSIIFFEIVLVLFNFCEFMEYDEKLILVDVWMLGMIVECFRVYVKVLYYKEFEFIMNLGACVVVIIVINN